MALLYHNHAQRFNLVANAYALADRAKRMHILNEVCETIGYERKYAARLLTGSRKVRKSRRKIQRTNKTYNKANQRKTIAEEQKLSVQYLANQKPPDYLQSVFSI